MLRSLLLALDGIADAEAAVETAAYLASAAGVSIDVRLTLDRAEIAGPEASGVAGLSSAEHRDAVIIRRLGGRLDSTGRLAGERLTAAGAAFTIDRLDGDVRAELPRLAMGHDLVLLSNALRRRLDSDDLDVTFALPAEELIRSTPRPFLLADRRSLGGGDGRPALAAFDGGRAAVAALRSAAALGLLDGREAHVVSVGEDRAEAERLAAEGCAILSGHGAVAAIPRPLLEDDGEVADLIAAELDRLEAGLLVMGAFGERSFAEPDGDGGAAPEEPVYRH